jgi:pimeloyl-ACP methyl ester carboxylesterase
MLCGCYEVPEDRARPGGRKIELRIAVLPARKKGPKADPVFWIAGGPGDSAVGWASRYRTSWMRRDRDLVMVDQRGTGESGPLLCDLPGSPSDIQGYMETYFGRRDVFRACKAELEKIASLRKYTTPVAVEDLEEVRQAMGYDQSCGCALRRHSRSLGRPGRAFR